jgi:hypothetical protein
MQDQDFSKVEQRVKRYWYSDGLGEILGGVVFILLALYFTAQQYFSETPIGNMLQVTFILIVIGLIIFGRMLINFLKTRLTYPRTGYIEYRVSGRNAVLTRVISVAIAMAVAIASVFIARRIESIDSMVALTGVLVSVIFLVKQGWASGIARFYFFSLLSLALGIGLSVSGFASGYNLGLFYGLIGLTLAISGSLILRRYLNENPMPVRGDNG